MRAATQDRYGIDAVYIADLAMPEPRAGEVRLRVIAASMNPADWHRATGIPRIMRLTDGLRRPKQRINGIDVCGTVDAIGPGVSDWQVGDVLFGAAKGSFAQYCVADAAHLARVPTSISELEAAALPIAGVTALQAVDRGEVAGKRVVVNGASGGVGHIAVQIAQAAGAAHVAAVCSARNADWVAALGADEVIDYERADFTEGAFDVVIDCIGNRRGRDIADCLPDDGRWVLLGADKKTGLLGPMPRLFGSAIAWKFRRQSCELIMAKETTERLTRLADLVDRGAVSIRIAGKRPLADVVDAYDRIESRRTAGKVLVLP